MAKVKWTKKLAVGIDIIDTQHVEFIDDCAQVETAISAGVSRDAIIAAIDKLEKMAILHFGTEAGFMKNPAYIETSGHKKLHTHFLESLRTVRERARRGEKGSDFAVYFKQNLSDWFILHIEKTDKVLKDYNK